MSALDEYANKYKTARMERRNGVLQVTLHTEGQSLRWGFRAAVVFGDVLDEDGKKIEAEIRASGGQATSVHLNVTGEAEWRTAVATVVTTYSPAAVD